MGRAFCLLSLIMHLPVTNITLHNQWPSKCKTLKKKKENSKRNWNKLSVPWSEWEEMNKQHEISQSGFSELAPPCCYLNVVKGIFMSISVLNFISVHISMPGSRKNHTTHSLSLSVTGELRCSWVLECFRGGKKGQVSISHSLQGPPE